MGIIRRLLAGKGTYSDPAVNKNCTEFEVNNWIISEFILKELIPVVGITPYPLEELSLMVAAVCRLKPTHIFEWGTHFGKSARIFYETTTKFRIGTEIHSIDLPDEVPHVEHPKSKRGLFVRGIQGINLHQGDGLEKSLEIINSISGTVNPLFFLDGDHSYESVKRELETIMTNVPNANILLHDTFYQSAESGYNIGPYKAIRDTLKSVANSFIQMNTNAGLPGMTLLYRL